MQPVTPVAVPLPSLTPGPRAGAEARVGVLLGVAALLAVGPPLSTTLTALVGAAPEGANFVGVVIHVMLLSLAGGAGAWLGGRWWGCDRGSLAVGVAWQFAVTPQLAGGEPRTVLAPVLWPVVLGLTLRAVARRELAPSVAAGLAMGALLAADPTHAGGGAVTLILIAAVAGGGGATRAGAGAGLFAAGLALLVALPLLALTRSFRVPPHAPLGTWALDLLAALGLLGLGRHATLPRRVLLPGMLALAGALPLPALLRGAPLLPLAVALGVGGLVAGLPTYSGARRPSTSTPQVAGPSSKS